MVKTLTLVQDMTGCTLWRVLLPVTELQRQGVQGIEWGYKNDNRLANIVHKFDAVILPRLYWPKAEQAKADKWIGALHKAGIAVIYEVDDDFFSEELIHRAMWRDELTLEEATAHRDSAIIALKQCDGVTVSSQRLATMVRNFTDRPVKVVHNYMDLRWFKRIQKRSTRIVPGLTVGWGGSFRPDSDLELLAEVWAVIAKKYPHVTFVLQGRDLDIFYKAVGHERIVQIEWMPIEKYPAGLVNTDIGCCPLPDTRFTRAKTFIKAMEYAASGAAVVASPTVYRQIIDPGYDGFICETVDEWVDALSQLIEDYTLRHVMSKRLLAKVRKQYSLEANAWRWVEAWGEIIGDFRNRNRRRILLPSEVVYA